jgi:site-specific DNA-methyltransferase (adenine-specific)
MLTIHQADNSILLPLLPNDSIQLIYIDPPFNTQRTQSSHAGSYKDSFEDFEGWIKPKLEQTKRVLTKTGSLFVHLDVREVHYVKVLLDRIFGRDSFINEIIWAYDYGGRSKNKWPSKHDSILWYAKNPDDYVFNYDAIDRIPYMAPGLVGPEKATKGKTPTDVWWQTIVPTQSKERTGYPTQKPLPILERIIKVHSNPGDVVLDFFAGSGTTGEAACMYNRQAILVDSNPEAIAVMRKRLGRFQPNVVIHS